MGVIWLPGGPDKMQVKHTGSLTRISAKLCRGGSNMATAQIRKTTWPADEVSRTPIDRLAPYARNARTHSPEQVDQLARSMKEWEDARKASAVALCFSEPDELAFIGRSNPRGWPMSEVTDTLGLLRPWRRLVDND